MGNNQQALLLGGFALVLFMAACVTGAVAMN